jgi:predicted dehydrogenase
MKEIRVGVIGFGLMGRTHAEAFHRDHRATLVAVADPHLSEQPSSEGNLDAQEEFMLPDNVAVHASATDLLARDDIDAVVVAAPTVFHADLAVAVLESGRHLLVEKPLALDSTEAVRVAKAGAARPDLVAWPAMCMRFWPEWKHLRHGLRSGQWGAVQQARFERIGAIPSWGGDFFQDHTKSGGALLDLHIHDVDFVRSCFGTPDRLHAFGRRGASGGFDHVHAVFEFDGIPGGVHAEGAWLEGDVPFMLRFMVVCARAVLRYDISATPTLSVHPTDGTEPMDLPDFPEGSCYQHQAAAFLDAIQSQEACDLTLEDGVQAMALVEAERSMLSP